MAGSIRHIKRLDAGATGASRTLLGRQFEPFTAGLNDPLGWQEAEFEERLYDEGSGSLSFPNAAGSDGVLHRNRFGISAQLSAGLPGPTRPSYMPGDEYVEIYTGSDLLYTGTPLKTAPSRGPLGVELISPDWLLRKQREYYAGFWTHAPRDVWEHYTSAWVVYLADDFASPPDGRFATSGTVTTASSHVRLAPGSSSSVATLRGAGGGRSQFEMGWSASNPERFNAWQLKVQLHRSKFGSETAPPYGDNAYCRVGLWNGQPLIFIELKERKTIVHGPTFVPGGDDFAIEANPATDAGNYEVIVEGRDRWVYFFLNQSLVYVLPMPQGPNTCVPFVSCRTGDSTSSQHVDVDSFVFRRTQPFLMKGPEKGDYHLPGAPTPGGLWGKYYNDRGAGGGSADDDFKAQYAAKQFSPWHDEPAWERLDPSLNFTAPNFTVSPKSTWQPRGASDTDGLWWSCRWTGSIYLELGDGDITLGYTTQEEGARMWIGKTRMGEWYIGNWLESLGGTKTGSVGLRAHLDGVSNVNGWYPIIIEYGQRGTEGASFHLHYADGTTVPTSKLSPYGVFDDRIRNDSHFGAIHTLADVFGYQYTFEPRVLEDDAFPGILVPRKRVGRDSNKILTQDENEAYGSTIDASEVARAVLGDAAGLQLDEGGDGVTAEVMDYALAEASTMLMSEYDQSGDISHPPLLAQRLRSYLYLRSSGWEQVGVQPPGTRELTDTFPVTGDLALLEWNAGDGVRLNLPRIGVVDGSPRQILNVTRKIYQAGLGPITVGFKSRPRNLKDFFQRMQRITMGKSRNYQGQLVTSSGSLAIGGSTEEVSWLPLPANLQKVKEARVSVVDKPDGDSPWYFWINDQPQPDLPPVTRAGIYDITKAVDYYDGPDGDARSPVMKIELKTDPGP